MFFLFQLSKYKKSPYKLSMTLPGSKVFPTVTKIGIGINNNVKLRNVCRMKGSWLIFFLEDLWWLIYSCLNSRLKIDPTDCLGATGWGLVRLEEARYCLVRLGGAGWGLIKLIEAGWCSWMSLMKSDSQER